jgi:hypothetical protein
MNRLLTALILAVGCGGEAPEGDPPHVELLLDAGGVIDPEGAGASLPLTAHYGGTSEGCTIAWSVEDPVGNRIAWGGDLPPSDGDTVTSAWDGRFDDGLPADPGPVWIAVLAACPGGSSLEDGAEGWVARLGLSNVDLQGHPEDGGAVTLAFHKTSLWEDGVTVLEGLPEYRSHPAGALSDLDDDAGAPRPAIEPWANPDMPPWGDGEPGDVAYNLPAAFVAGVRVRVAAWLGTTALSERTGTPLDALGPVSEYQRAPALRLVAEGATPMDEEGAASPGDATLFDTEPLPATLGRTDLTLAWRFQAKLGDHPWTDVPGGAVTTTHRVYLLLDEPVLLDGTDRGAAAPHPWVGALEDTVAAVQGVEADAGALLDAIRDHLHFDPYLVYNPSDRAYTGYSGSYIYWDWIWADLTAWLDRQDGVELYCHSVSCLLSVLSNTWGADTEQEVLGVGFTTNYVRAAGTDTWQRWGFNSHSVASPDGGATIWDASIDMDGDGDPGSAPHEALAPKGLNQAEYLSLLTPDPITIVNSGACYVF